MLKISCGLFCGIAAFLFCSNINAIDYKSHDSVFSDDLNISYLSDDYLMTNAIEDNFSGKLRSSNNNSQIVRYSTKCRGKNNPYNNHAFLEIIDITKWIEKIIKENKYLPY